MKKLKSRSIKNKQCINSKHYQLKKIKKYNNLKPKDGYLNISKLFKSQYLVLLLLELKKKIWMLLKDNHLD